MRNLDPILGKPSSGLYSTNPDEFADADFQVFQQEQQQEKAILHGEASAPDHGYIAIHVTLDRLTFTRDGFIIARIEGGHTVLGNMTDPVIGQEYELTGKWVEDPKWGSQFKFIRYAAQLPQSPEGIIRYLSRVAKWVGPIVARAIVKQFGLQTLEILKTDPQQVADAIKGLTIDRANEISVNLKVNEDREGAMVELESMLGDQHLPKHTIPTLVEKYHSDAPARVRSNPYSLIEIRGIGFVTADRVAMSHNIGFVRDGIERRMAATMHVLKDAAESRGHTVLPLRKLIDRVEGLIGYAPGVDAIARLGEEGRVWTGGEMVGLAGLARDESEVASIVKQLLSDPADLSDKVSVDLKGLTEDQVKAFKAAMAHPVFILTGAPGTGKSYLIRRILDQFDTWNLLVSLAAPTGKAAKRMNELTERPASTIHRLLGPEPCQVNGETTFAFHYGPGQPLNADVVVIDEFSMVDVSLAASLLRAIAPGTRLLIVGDHYQLPSVGHGAVLRDLLAAGVPSYELTQIKRNTGDIVKVCHAIKDGLRVSPSFTLDPGEGLNLRHIEASDPVRIQEIIKDLVTNRLPKRPEHYNPVWDVQVLSPMNERTALSCKDLNELLQNALNIHPPVKGSPFRVGDKVLQRKNQDIGDEFVVNGDLGEAEEITGQEIVVNFKFPDRRVRVKRGENHLALAYCITIHKCQGSEAPVIIIPLHSSFGIFPNRELIYTAISRARDICITVGEWGYLEQAVGRVGNVRRITRLSELLKGEVTNA